VSAPPASRAQAPPGALESRGRGRRRLTASRRWWWLPLLGALVGAALGYVIADQREPRYVAQASLLFRDPAIDSKLFEGDFFAPTDDPEREAATNVRLVSLSSVARRVAADGRLGMTPVEVADSITVTAEGGADIVVVSAETPDPDQSVRVANRYATEYVAFRRDADRAKILGAARLIRNQVNRLPAERRSSAEAGVLEQRAGELETLAAIQTGNAEVVEPATRPTEPSEPRPRRAAAVGGLLGLLAGLVALLVATRLDQRIRTAEDAEGLLEVPTLAQIPQSGDVARLPSAPETIEAVALERFHMLRLTLRYFSVTAGDISSILVTSASPAEGKTTTAWGLALAAAAGGESTLLVEADMRQGPPRPGAERVSGGGLAGVLAGLEPLASAIAAVEVDVGGAEGQTARFDVLRAGGLPPNPLQLLQSPHMRDLMERVQESYAFVVVDTPPVTAVADALALVGTIDGVVVVTRLGTTTRASLHALHRQLTNVSAPVLGLVLNGVEAAALPYPYPRKRQG
jgi:non-specific protein-tyrosine kinase